jgi:hypothetical protein
MAQTPANHQGDGPNRGDGEDFEKDGNGFGNRGLFHFGHLFSRIRLGLGGDQRIFLSNLSSPEGDVNLIDRLKRGKISLFLAQTFGVEKVEGTWDENPA